MNAVTEKKPRLTTSAMIASIASEGQRVQAAPFGKALVEYAANHPEVVGMTADLAKYTDLHLFAQAFPERFFQMGMAEQLLMGAAGGMAKTGLVPFATTYAVFGSDCRRKLECQDLLRLARLDHGLWPKSPSHRRLGDDACDSWSHCGRPLRCTGH
jgi:transketolase